MAKKSDKQPEALAGESSADNSAGDVLRLPAEVLFADQLEALRQHERDRAPHSWKLAPRSVLTYVLGGKTLDATIGGKKQRVEITRKFFGDAALIERAIVTLASDRALLLIGDPGTGKSWLSEHLAAAISGNSTLAIQGTAGTTEEHIKYSWNIARVIAEGPNPGNLIPAPTMVAMRVGGLLRFEEITRCLPDVQDALVSIISDKNIAIPELPDANNVFAKPGFNIIATANSRDQGVNDLSAALKSSTTYTFPLSRTKAPRLKSFASARPTCSPATTYPRRSNRASWNCWRPRFASCATEKRARASASSRRPRFSPPLRPLGTAVDAVLHSRYFGDGKVTSGAIARNLVGSIVKDPQDLAVLKEYVTIVAKKRGATDKNWKGFHEEAERMFK